MLFCLVSGFLSIGWEVIYKVIYYVKSMVRVSFLVFKFRDICFFLDK